MNEPWKLKRTAQCEACPWRTTTNPRADIPDYSEDQHKALADTIAKPDGDIGDAMAVLSGRQPMRIFTCHDTKAAHCVGWLANQLGRGNNIALRIQMASCTNADKLRLRGEQHQTFEQTLPEKGTI